MNNIFFKKAYDDYCKLVLKHFKFKPVTRNKYVKAMMKLLKQSKLK